jgi:hypothetical protein
MFMNEAMALSRGWGMATAASAGEALGIPGSISEGAARQLPGSAEILMRTTNGLLEDCILSAIEKRTAADFIAWRGESFDQYFNAVLGLPSLIKLVVPQHLIDRLNREFFCELEADLRDKGLAAFGLAVRDQAMFTSWTLRKISDLVAQIPVAPKINSTKVAEVREIVSEFIFQAIWTRFHLHCLVTSMRANKVIYPEPLEVILDGLRSAVNAYALARRAVDALAPIPMPKAELLEWDDEDSSLLAEAGLEALSENI